jgi:hypothetical protein
MTDGRSWTSSVPRQQRLDARCTRQMLHQTRRCWQSQGDLKTDSRSGPSIARPNHASMDPRSALNTRCRRAPGTTPKRFSRRRTRAIASPSARPSMRPFARPSARPLAKYGCVRCPIIFAGALPILRSLMDQQPDPRAAQPRCCCGCGERGRSKSSWPFQATRSRRPLPAPQSAWPHPGCARYRPSRSWAG